MRKTKNLYDILQQIKKRPAMWVQDYSIDEISLICFGYESALQVSGINEFGSHFSNTFSNFLKKKYKWNMSYGWAHAIKVTAYSSEKSFKKFFILLEEYNNEFKDLKKLRTR